VAELVDALVSNTNGAIRAGSIPALGTKPLSKRLFCLYFLYLRFYYLSKKLRMNIVLEWEGVSGIIKLTLIFLIPLAIGFVIGRKTK
tara:strand:- start:478 stop:738 length:261 start_codon:yes stop_codon:yes gene_type:complete